MPSLTTTRLTAVVLACAALAARAMPVMMDPPSLWQLADRDVGVLTCTTVHTGILGWTHAGSSTPSGHVSLVGPKTSSGQPILHTTKSSGADVTPTSFDFRKCVSNNPESFIGTPTNTKDIYVGHITPAGDANKCLSATHLGSSGGNLVLEDCSFSDDSGQLFQTFTLPESDTVHFLGHQFGSGEDRITDVRYQLTKSTAKLGELVLNKVAAGSEVQNEIELIFYQ